MFINGRFVIDQRDFLYCCQGLRIMLEARHDAGKYSYLFFHDSLHPNMLILKQRDNVEAWKGT